MHTGRVVSPFGRGKYCQFLKLTELRAKLVFQRMRVLIGKVICLCRQSAGLHSLKEAVVAVGLLKVSECAAGLLHSCILQDLDECLHFDTA